MPKCFARVIARQWITSLLAAAVSNHIGNLAACQIGPFVTEDACPPPVLCATDKKFTTAATRLRFLDAEKFRGRQEASLSVDRS